MESFLSCSRLVVHVNYVTWWQLGGYSNLPDPHQTCALMADQGQVDSANAPGTPPVPIVQPPRTSIPQPNSQDS